MIRRFVPLMVLLLSCRAEPAPPTVTPPAATSTSSTTVVSTTTSVPATSTTLPVTRPTLPPISLVESSFEVVVVGDGLGGVAAAITAARLSAKVVLLSPTGYFGGQASAAGVATMDEGAGREVLRQGGLYRELIDHLETVYGSRTMGGCYFSSLTICPEPDVIHEFFESQLEQAGVAIRSINNLQGVSQEDERVTGVVADSVLYQAEVIIDATELQELYPMVEGLDYAYGDESGCLQDMTWVAIINWYPGGAPEELVPPPTALDDLAAQAGRPTVDLWLNDFRSVVGPADPAHPPGAGWPSTSGPWSLDAELSYRALGDTRSEADLPDRPLVTRTGVNHANDATLSAGSLEEAALGRPALLEHELRQAIDVTYAYLWYLRYELHATEWGVANDLGYDQAKRLVWNDVVPDQLERHLPPMPYIREGRRLLARFVLFGSDVAGEIRNTHRFGDSVMLGHYFTDSHGCPLPGSLSGDGLYEVPLGVFLPIRIDGFLPGMPRAAGLDRVVAASLRLQPDEIWGGQVVGALAGLAALANVSPREVPAVEVQEVLSAAGWTTRLP